MTCQLCKKPDSAMAGILWCHKCAIQLSRPDGNTEETT